MTESFELKVEPDSEVEHDEPDVTIAMGLDDWAKQSEVIAPFDDASQQVNDGKNDQIR